jgi:hypothetical protein
MLGRLNVDLHACSAERSLLDRPAGRANWSSRGVCADGVCADAPTAKGSGWGRASATMERVPNRSPSHPFHLSDGPLV